MKTDRDEMKKVYRGPAIDASYQVSVHLAMWFQRRRYLKISQSETRIAYGGHVLLLKVALNTISQTEQNHINNDCINIGILYCVNKMNK